MEMEGGIFQSACSLASTERGGECMTGTGGDPGPRGTFLCLNLGGSSGSLGAWCILISRCDAPEACASLRLDGVYLMYSGAEPSAPAVSDVLPARLSMRPKRVALVLSSAAWIASSEGRSNVAAGFATSSPWPVCVVRLGSFPAVTMAS